MGAQAHCPGDKCPLNSPTPLRYVALHAHLASAEVKDGTDSRNELPGAGSLVQADGGMLSGVGWGGGDVAC